MTRRIAEQLIFEGKLVATAPLHVGGAETGVDVDLLLAENGAGEFYIPGASLAGALRAWFHRAFGNNNNEKPTTALFGPETEDMRDPQKGHASFVLVEDAVLVGEGCPEIRDGVGIDRFSGTAAPNIKFTRQVLPRGTRFRFCLTAELQEKDREKNRARIAHLIQALCDGEIALGAARTRGLGRVKLEKVEVQSRELLSRKGVLAALEGETKPELFKLDDFRHSEVNPAATRPVEIRVKWRPVLPIMVKADVEGVAVDMLPLFTGEKGGEKLTRVLPGSSIKGALRGMAERILATVLDEEEPSGPAEERKGFLEQLERFELAEALFGAPGKRKKSNDDARERNGKDKPKWRPGLGALAVDDCHCEEHVITPQNWRDLMKEEDPAKTEQYGMRHATHVAVDRWTGGAAGHALYSVLEPHGGEWEEIVLRIGPGRLPPEDPQRGAALALLFLTLRELARERIPLGFGTNRGMGAIEVEKITVIDPEGLLKKDGVSLKPADFANADKLSFLTDVNAHWQQWWALARAERAAKAGEEAA